MKKLTNSRDLSKILKKYSNEWLALSSDQKRVLGRGSHPRDAYQKAKAKGEDRPILLRAPKDFGTYIL